MTSSSEQDEILEAAVAGIPRVAQVIVETPIEHRARALDAVERSYRQTVRDLGHPEEDAKIWVSAVMFRLLAATEEQEGATLSPLKISHEELV
jgi:hypothetical protein